MIKVKLKPCPFCGGKAGVCRTSGDETYHVVCRKCRVSTDSIPFMEQAIEAWNKRVETVRENAERTVDGD